MPVRNLRRVNGLTILEARDPRMRQLRRAGHVAEIHGNKVWNSSFLVMQHLKRHPLPKRTRVLEIGCGWGLLGLFCAQRFDCRVHGIDADANVLPYLQLHAEVNSVQMTAERRSFEQLSTAFLAEFDVILGADVCFWDDMARQLYNLIRRARRAGVSQTIIADPGRPPFDALAERCAARLDGVERLQRRLSRPVRAYGELLLT
ncbi:MAG: class I SAM-dependent methyltransferase [Gammaproteobacteria bacterium]|nr:MAG: class I SAM-dependent methyltransferase [Gammaproteobacteria bacterium]